MTLARLFVGAGCACALLSAVVLAQDRTIWDGVYTDAQAKRGEAIYFERCVRCHGPTLSGGTDGAGPLTGPTFKSNWNGVPLGMMLDRVRMTMPQDKPATLSRQQTADVLTFILRANKAPAGATELSRQAEILNSITFTAAAK
jgi:mono/diheme cytochrome c family protein